MIVLVIWIALISHSSCHSLQHCINHILHESGNQNFKCKGDEEIHFYSTYVLPDGAYRCLEDMKGKQGFYVSTVKDFKYLIIKDEQIQAGYLTRNEMKYRGWRCDDNGFIKTINFKGLKLFMSKCKHNQENFEDICIIKGWPLKEVEEQEVL